MEDVPLEQRILFYYDNNDDEYNYSEVFNCVSYLISSSCNQLNFVKEVKEINSKEVQINTGNLSKGLYMVEITSNNLLKQVKKLVIN